jgi:hypothetical protein
MTRTCLRLIPCQLAHLAVLAVHKDSIAAGLTIAPNTTRTLRFHASTRWSLVKMQPLLEAITKGVISHNAAAVCAAASRLRMAG